MAKKIIKKSNLNNETDELLKFVIEKLELIDKKIDRKPDRIELVHLENGINRKMNMAIADLKDEMLTHIDGLANKIDEYQTEQAMIMSQLGRHENWHYKVAAKVGVDLLSE
ncbi:MAG: hypothetical protein WCX69_02085 [Candidatus Paceibacterota bacterium]